jgi:hypothetical protein
MVGISKKLIAVIGVIMLLSVAVVLISGCTTSAPRTVSLDQNDGHKFSTEYAKFAVSHISGINPSNIVVTNDVWDSDLMVEYFEATYTKDGVTHDVKVIVGVSVTYGPNANYEIMYYSDNCEEA